jgi:hypothetical protein
MKKIQTVFVLLLAMFLLSATAFASNTWFVRVDGGTRYSAAVPIGQCDGLADVAYPGSGVNKHCAFNDFRYTWSDNSGAATAWVIAGGDTVVIRGCTALPSQINPSNPDCRLGYDNPTNGNAPNFLGCGYGVGPYVCFNPPIPPGTALQHTRILGGCVLAGTCSTGNVTNRSNLTQLFSGFALTWAINLRSTQYVDIQGIELTTHNISNCTSAGSPTLRGCVTSPPLDDFGGTGFLTNNATSNITFQDLYVDGFNASAFNGPIGGPIVMTRVNASFNAFAAWNFDDGSSTPDGPGSSITATDVTMNWNGCYQEYPIVDPIPARVCYDTNSQGFGDSWSGQNTTMDFMICIRCVSDYNTKDGFIGPHTAIANLTIQDSESIGNMGQNWKWGGLAVPTTVLFTNNLTSGNCNRLSQPFPGAPVGYNKYLTGFCRAAGNLFGVAITSGSTWLIADNSFVTYQPTIFDIACPLPLATYAPCPSTVGFTDNIVLGYVNPLQPSFNGSAPGLWFIENSAIKVVATNNLEFGVRNGNCPAVSGSGNLCTDPTFVGEPAQATTAIPFVESELDLWNFHLANGSPAIGAGVPISGIILDYDGNTRSTTATTIGAFEVPGTLGGGGGTGGTGTGGGTTPPPPAQSVTNMYSCTAAQAVINGPITLVCGIP